MDRTNFVSDLSAAAVSGSLLTFKHDPASLGTAFTGYRTVMSFEFAANLEEFLCSGEYTITEYNNSAYPKTPYYMVLTPNSGSAFVVPGSGVPHLSLSATSALDCIVAVSGSQQGWHIFAESATLVSGKVQSGDLQFVASY